MANGAKHVPLDSAQAARAFSAVARRVWRRS